MRQFRTWAACALAVVMGLGIWASTWGDEGDLAGVRSYVAANPQAKVLYIGDSWIAGDYYEGKVVAPGANRPYTFAQAFADQTCNMGNEFSQALSRRLGTNRFAAIGQGSMELMLDDDANTGRAQQDSSIFGVMRPYFADLYNPDIVILPGGGGGNDLFSGANGSDYTELRAETIATAKQAINTFSGADWIVWIGPRPIGVSIYDAQTGTAAQKRALTVTKYGYWETFNTFVSDTLRSALAADGVNVSKFVTFDAWDYAVGDTTGLGTYFETTTSAQYNAVRHIRWSDEEWCQTDMTHLNDYGNRCWADSIAANLFDISLSDAYTKASGDTVYCDLQNGNNWTNRMDCTQRSRPLATVQAAVGQAHPGDIVKVIGDGNQSVMAWDSTGSAWVSARNYELRVNKKGLTILLEDGAYFQGVYDASSVDISNGLTTVGTGFLQPFKCTAGTIADSLSHGLTASFWSSKPKIDLDLSIIGENDNWISGYQTPLAWNAYDRMEFKNLSITGGSANYSVLVQNPGGTDLTMRFEDCIFYPDSGSASGTGLLVWQTFDGSNAFALNDTTSFDGYFKGCTFLGKNGTALTAITGPLQGIQWIECLWDDPDVNGSWISFGTSVVIPTGLFEPTWFVNCAWRTTDNLATQYAVKYLENGEDTLYFANCEYSAPNCANPFIIDFAIDNGTGLEVYCIGTTFIKADFNTGTDLTAAAAGAATTVTDGYSIRSYNTKSLGLTGDTLRFGGVQSFAGYDLTDHFGISHPTKTASIGPVQYGYDPLVWTSGAVQGRPSAATMAGPWEILKFVNAGVMATSTITDPSTWFEIPRIYDESSLAVARSFLDAWEKWPAAAQAKVRFKVSGEPVTTITAADGSVYQTLGALDAAITATTESASDSLTASTWFTLPRPYNLNAAFQIEILRAWHRTLAEANRKKIHLRVSGTDYSLAQPDTTYSQGLWAVLKAITTGAETASDSLNDATWFAASRVYDMAQAQQYGIYRDAMNGWPDTNAAPTRRKVRLKTK